MITAIIPAFNEEKFIKNAIQLVAFADEIIVIDSYSTDKTVEIVKQHNVKLIQRTFDDFSSQKNYAISQAKNNWVFILDADEKFSEELQNEVQTIVKNNTNKVGFYIYRNFYFLDTKINYGGWQSDKVIRLFRKDKCQYNGNLVHEIIDFNGEIGYLKNKLDHYSYRGFDHYASKLNQYAALQAKALLKQNKKVTVLHTLLKPPFRFFVHFIVRKGFLDGIRGFILATIHANGVKNRYIKYWLFKNNLN